MVQRRRKNVNLPFHIGPSLDEVKAQGRCVQEINADGECSLGGLERIPYGMEFLNGRLMNHKSLYNLCNPGDKKQNRSDPRN